MFWSLQSNIWAISIGLGAPIQPLVVSLDTGAADTWVNSAASDACKSQPGCTQLGGGFNVPASTPAGQAFQYTYSDGTQASGDYVRDTLKIAGQSLENFEFAVGTSAKPTIGKFGLSYPASQAITSGGTSPYSTIYDILVSKGLISTKSFSLWLDSATSGRLIFGGVDTARYSGDLGVVPIQPVNGVYQNFGITLSKISLSEQDESVDLPSSGTALPVNVVLNTGSLFTYLPSAVVTDVFRGVRVVGVLTRGGTTTGFADCNLGQSGITVDFFFGSVKISIPVAGLLFDFDVYKQTDNNGNQVCGLKIRPTDTTNYVLGLSFFEIAYVVFDLTNNQISLAPAVRGATESNVIEVGQSPDTTNGGEVGTNDNGVPNLEGLTYVDPKDYGSLSPDGTLIPYEDYIKEKEGGQSGSEPDNSISAGKFFEIDPKDFNKINPADLIPYDQFIASLGGKPPANQTPADQSNTGNTNQPTTPSENVDDQVFPPSGDQGTAGTDTGTAGIDGTTVDPGTPGTVGTTTVIQANPDDSELIDPVTGFPVDQSIVGGDDSLPDDSFGDPFSGTGFFKRAPAPAAQRKRRSFY